MTGPDPFAHIGPSPSGFDPGPFLSHAMDTIEAADIGIADRDMFVAALMDACGTGGEHHGDSDAAQPIVRIVQAIVSEDPIATVIRATAAAGALALVGAIHDDGSLCGCAYGSAAAIFRLGAMISSAQQAGLL